MSEPSNHDFDPRVPLQAGDEDGTIEQASSSDTGNDPRRDDQPLPPSPPR